ncbi:P-loop containing nucleoside triphosphate hydrolase protein [Russula earlei]|uniref:P-loop containing nucleoside triphosphate hydrolase protein n=1 Tax=Russula earlei TaxID=71964 RepID=A0ACC0UAW7_9AGAM|nr:P-loop containing nucleoside triphosphate hydrolase protein [Russula earlei]
MSSQVDLPTAPVGLSDPQYATRRKRMYEFLTRVRALGADVDLDIPAIAVLGSQSAGKSSLIEAISGVSLPRASGTCTRCPTECQLTQSDTPWACTVSLQINTTADGSASANSKKVPFGEPITVKSEVTERIRRAQKAILSPSTPPEAFLQGTDIEPEIPFSANRIVLHISGPDVTDLNFIDLPGLIVGGQENEIKLIKDLAISYVRKPSCIILVTVSCETDFVNQGAHLLAKEYDPRGDRTVGILTKPDRIPPTEEDNWLPFIRGEHDDTTVWFCVKCPNSQAIDEGISWERARRAESKFFSENAPWSMLRKQFKQKLGTGHVTHHLSDKLCDLISERLPYIERELNELLVRTNRELEELPQPPSSTPLKKILQLITDFTRAVERQGEGIPGRGGLLQQIRLPQEKFRLAIRKTAPSFVPQFKKRPIHEPPHLDEFNPPFALRAPLRVMAAVDESPPSFPINGKKSKTSSQRAPAISKVETQIHPPFLIGEEHYGDTGLDDGKSIFIDDVLETAEWAVTRELPNNYPFIVQKEYIIAFVKEWDDPSQGLFISTVEKLKELTLCIVDKHFGPYTYGHLKQRVSNIVVTHLDRCSKETSKRVKFLLEVEKEPSTKNTHYFKDYRRKFLCFYNGLYHKDSNDNFIERVQGQHYQSTAFAEALAVVMENLPKLGLRDVKPLELAILQTSEDSDGALRIMADVRAYFQVAFKRFVDNVIKAIDEELVLGLPKGLQDALMSGLKLDSPDAHETCARLVAEQPHIAEKRKGLLATQERLLLAREELYTALS